MPTFSSSDKQVITIRAPQDQVIRAMTEPDRIKEALAEELESSAKVDDHTVRWIRKPVEEKGVRFRGDYTVHYEYDGRGKITWHTIGQSNMRSNGEALVATAADGGTRVEYSEAIECDMEVNRILAAVLRPIVERKIKRGVADYLANVKASLERAAG